MSLNKKRKRTGLFTFLLCFLSVFLSFCGNVPAPDFTLVSISGEKLTLSKLKGKVVLINFFASWCAPCRKEIPSLNALQKKYATDLLILGIDYESTTKEKVSAVKKDMGIEFTYLVDKNKLVQKGYKLVELPASFLIDADGNLVESISGGILDEQKEKVEEKIKTLVNEVRSRKKSLLVSLSSFENLTGLAKTKNAAEKLRSAITAYLKTQKGITLSEKPVLRIEGSVSMFTEDEAGVEIKIVEAATGNILDTLSTVVTDYDFSALLSDLYEQLNKLSQK